MLKGAHAPGKQQFSLAAEAGMPVDMIPAYLPQREQLSEQSIPAGETVFTGLLSCHPEPWEYFSAQAAGAMPRLEV